MTIGKLDLPTRWAAVPHFKTAYAQTNRAADLLARHTPPEAPDGLSRDESRELVRLLAEALEAARELDNLLKEAA